MAFLRNMFRRNEVAPESIAVRATNDSAPPMAFYLNGQGRMQAIKADGYIGSGHYSRVGLGYMIRNQEQYARAAIASVWAANCISLRSDTMARLEWLVRDKKSKEPIEGHPFTVALENSKQNVIRLLEKRLLTYGEFFAKPLRNDDQFFSGFHVLNNLDVEVDTSQGFISEFQYNPQGVGQVFTFAPDDVVYIHTDNDFDDLRGLSKLEHVLLEIQIDRDISRTTAAFYRNDARPGVLLIPEINMSPHRAQEVIEYWNAQFEGPDKTGRTVIMPEAIKEVVDFQRAPALDDVELRESTRREVCAAFKVPLSMAGAWDDATYQSLPEQRMAFYEETIIPAAESNARDLTKFALPFFDDSRITEVYFDAATILALVENRAEDVDIATRKLNSGAYTMNEMRKSLGDEPVLGGNIHIMQSGWIPVQAGELATFEAPNVAQVPEEMLSLPEPEQAIEATEETEATPETLGSAPTRTIKQSLDGFAGISLPNNQQLVNIQRELKRILDDDNIEWELPPIFHVTLAYSPSMEADELFDAANGFTFDEFPIMGSKLDIFENGEERALHIALNLDVRLRDTQQAIYNRFVAQGVEMSPHSKPSQYTPHITLAYLSQGVALPSIPIDFKEMAERIVFTRDDYEPFATVRATTYKASGAINREGEPETIHSKAFKELQAWQKFVANGKKRKYQTYMIQDEIATIVNDAIESQDADAIKSAFEEAGELIAVKALRDVQSGFEKELKRLVAGGRSGKIRRATFTNTLKTAIRQFGADAIRVGLTDGGVITNKDENLETEDEVVFDGILAEQLRLVKALSEQVYKKGISDAQAKLKPRQWWGRSMRPFYDAGLLSADRNGMVEVVGIIDKNSCASCRALIGQRHRRRAFKETGLIPPYGSNIICGDGGLCKHRLISVNARARGSLARVPRG